MEYIKWQPEYSVGVAMIDKQHQRFIDILNELYSAIQSSKTEELEGIVSELAAYTKIHFDTEEKYFKEFNYEHAIEHTAEHRRIISEVDKFIHRKDENQLKVCFELLDFLENWLIEHLAMMDQGYTKCFNSHGLK